MIELSLIIPAYNEESRLPASLDKLYYYFGRFHYTHEILIVLNGCQDESELIVKKYKQHKHWNELRYINIPEAGKGRAVKAGILSAEGKNRLMIDLDLSTPLIQIYKFYAYSVIYPGVIIGNRIYKNFNPLRWLTHHAYRFLAKDIVELNRSCMDDPIRDYQAGFKLFSSAAAIDIFSRVSIDGWGFDVEVLYLAATLGYKIKQINIPWENVRGSKLHPLRDGIRMYRELKQLRSRYGI